MQEKSQPYYSFHFRIFDRFSGSFQHRSAELLVNLVKYFRPVFKDSKIEQFYKIAQN